MTKEREKAELLQAVATSAQINQLITDYLTPGLLCNHTQGVWDDSFYTGIVDPLYFFWHPFNRFKNTHDRMRVHGFTGVTGTTSTTEFSLDSGASWTALPAGVLTGLPMSTGTTVIASSAATDIDISAAAGPYIGLRANLAAPGSCTLFQWHYLVYFWHSTDTPY